MKCHGSDAEAKEAPKQGSRGFERVTLVGNPNVGKSVIFGLLTGRYATVSNYPGTTVEVSQANVKMEDRRFLVIDTPGVNSLMPMSEDERVTRDILMAERPSAVLQVGDAKNLKRTLSLTIQLAEMGLPVVLALNMQDEAMDRGITIDTKALKEKLGIDVAATVAPERKGLKELRAALVRKGPCVPDFDISYGADVENYIEMISGLLPASNISPRALAIMVLSGDDSLGPWLHARLGEEKIDEIERLRDECREVLGRPVGMHISEARLRLAGQIADEVVSRVEVPPGSAAETIGNLSMHPVWGVLVLLGILFGIYQFVGVFGAGTAVDFLESVIFGEYLNPMFTRVVELLVPIRFFQDMLVGEYGIITMALTYAVAIILPITTTFFIVFSLLEDSGYLPRLAIMSNRFFNVMGLSGKAVLPMVLGLGCGTMAVMTTRILETRRDRIIASFLLALAVPCSAQLGVILGMLGSQSFASLAIWLATVLLMLLFTGFLASKVVPGERSDFMLEIPPMRMPKAGNIVAKTWGRVFWYLKEVVPLFILGTLVLFVLDKLKVLGVLEKAASPVIVGLLGLPEKATGAFLIGFLRRDYGAAGLFDLAEKGLLDPVQIVVSLITMTLFVPCIANFLMLIKERGLKLALITLGLITPLAFMVGGAVNFLLRVFNISL